MKAIVAEFVGGPSDGRLSALPELVPTWRLPVMNGDCSVLNSGYSFIPSDSEYIDETVKVAEYELALDPDLRRPSINDEGHYRYTFKGYR